MSAENFENVYMWDKKLRFSWYNIFTFLAIIWITYVSFMGEFYSTGGDFMAALLRVGINDLLLMIFFLGAQNLKGTYCKLERRIKWERLLICLCPIVFVASMIPYNHFWNVYDQREQIEQQFARPIAVAKQMFDDYDSYCTLRMAQYDASLTEILKHKSAAPDRYKKAGFTGRNDALQKQMLMRALRLQLLSANTDSLKVLASQWIDDAGDGATVWNAFLIGNANQIGSAIREWDKTLALYSAHVLSNERMDGFEKEPFDAALESAKQAQKEVKRLSDIYTTPHGLNPITLWSGGLLFLFLLLPYVMQQRTLKAQGIIYLWPWRKRHSTSPLHHNEEGDDADIFHGTIV